MQKELLEVNVITMIPADYSPTNQPEMAFTPKLIALSKVLTDSDWSDNVKSIAFLDESNLYSISVIGLYYILMYDFYAMLLARCILQSILLPQQSKCLHLDFQIEYISFSPAQFDGSSFLRNYRLHSK
jgi:hypothetical protein